jgi:hypothetical protein
MAMGADAAADGVQDFAGVSHTTVRHQIAGDTGDRVVEAAMAAAGFIAMMPGSGVTFSPGGLSADEAAAFNQAVLEGRATSDAAAEFTTRAAALRQSIGGRFANGDGNVAFAEGVVDGQAIDLAATSGRMTPPGTVGLPSTRQFTTVPSGAMTRDFDTEVLLLEEIATRLRPDSVGTIRLFTEKMPCRSCGSVIEQFQTAFPGVDLQILTGQ